MADHDNLPDFNDDEEIGREKDQKLESIKGGIGEVREENERLKFLLGRLVNDYQSIQTNFFDILQQDEPKEDTKGTGIATTTDHHEESELVSLSLGISSQGQHRMGNSNTTGKRENEDEDKDKGLALGLDIKFDPAVTQIEAENNLSPESSLDNKGKEEEPNEMWPPSKVLKTMKIGDKSEVSQLKKAARVSIRARCDSQTMNDGCQWRKYGQKIAKGNPCPRAYYRCTVSPSCPVRKQVQRCAEDMSILITTYEGNHNHPLPLSATAMASTTSAAASMLQSPSLSSDIIAPIINSSAPHSSNALNFSTYQISRPHQFHLPNSSISTLNSHPTITLDLTASPTSTHSGNFTSCFSYTPSTNLNFSSSSSGFCPLQSSMPQSPWSNYSGSYFNSGAGTLAQIRNQGGYMFHTGKQPSQGLLHQPNYMSNHSISQQSLPDSIVAATKAITTNPKFQSALVTALTTYVGNGVGGGSNSLRENHVLESAAALKSKQSSEDVYSYTCNQNNIGTCAPSSRYLDVSSSAPNSINVFPPPPAVSKSASASSSNRSSQPSEQWK